MSVDFPTLFFQLLYSGTTLGLLNFSSQSKNIEKNEKEK